MRASFPLTLAAALAMTACGGSSGGNDSAAAPSPAAPAASSAPAAAGSTLAIASFQYDPTPLTVAPGATVSVSNSDTQGHTATSAGAFKTGNINKGQTVTFTAPTKPGTYTILCDYHPKMRGSLIVK